MVRYFQNLRIRFDVVFVGGFSNFSISNIFLFRVKLDQPDYPERMGLPEKQVYQVTKEMSDKEKLDNPELVDLKGLLEGSVK